MYRTMLVAAALFFSTGANAQQEWTSASKPGDGSVFTFRGYKMGDPLPPKLASDCLTSNDLPGMQSCQDRSLPRLSGGMVDLQGLPVRYLSYQFFDGRFAGFLINLPADKFSEMRRLLVARYGDPHAETPSSIQNQAGATFDQVVTIWNTPHGAMRLTKRSGKVTDSLLAMWAEDAFKEAQQRKQNAVPDRARRAF